MKSITLFAVALSFVLIPHISLAATSTNLVLNPSMETATVPGIPDHWSQGHFGTSNVVFSYPDVVVGGESSKAVKVDMTSYTCTVPTNCEGGDAKWYFDNVPAASGIEYTYTDSYQSDITTSIIIQYTYLDNSVSYAGATNDISWNAPATGTTTWGTFTHKFVTPIPDVSKPPLKSMTIFHLIAGVGSLTIDDTSLEQTPVIPVPASEQFSKGMLSFTFDDGWYSQYTNALPILNSEGVKGTFFIISKAAASSTPRGNLFTTTGTSASTKWTSQAITTGPGDEFVFADYFTSTTGTGTISAVYTKTSGPASKVTLGTFNASAVQQHFISDPFIVPANTTKITIEQEVTAGNTLTVDTSAAKKPFIGDNAEYVSKANVLAFQTAGHEVAAHTRTHPNLGSLSLADATAEIDGSKSDIAGMGITSVTTFAYPYGVYNDAIKGILSSGGFAGARTVDPGYNTRTSDHYQLLGDEVDNGTSLAQVERWIDGATDNKTWVNLVFHQIDDFDGPFSITPAMLTQIIDYAKTKNIRLVTVKQGLDIMSIPRPDMPTSTPPAGIYASVPFDVALTSGNSTSIHYEVNGTNPTCSSPVYASPISISHTTDLRAVGCNSEYMSDIAVLPYVITTSSNQIPVITVNGANPTNLLVGATYTEAGATAIDTEDGDISAHVVASGTVDTATAGHYTVSYSVSDSQSASAIEMTRTINVSEASSTNHAPVLTLIGSSTLDVNVGNVYSDAGVIATDEDADIAAHVVLTGTVNTATPGTYVVRYNVTDSGNLAAAEVIRVVNVVGLAIPNTKPVITLSGTSVIGMTQGTAYTELGATASDTEDGDITAHIVITGSVDTATVGDYSIHYNVVDQGGLPADEVTRVVSVTAPTTGTGGNFPSMGSYSSGQGSGSFSYYGCTNPSATNYNRLANTDDGSCVGVPSTSGGGGGGAGNAGNNTGTSTSSTTTPVTDTTASTTGEVLGASTTPSVCTPLITKNLFVGVRIDEVKKLQTFLNQMEGESLPITGYFGVLTKAAVSRFQVKYMDLILTPLHLTTPTGGIYAATRKVVNDVSCGLVK